MSQLLYHFCRDVDRSSLLQPRVPGRANANVFSDLFPPEAGRASLRAGMAGSLSPGHPRLLALWRCAAHTAAAHPNLDPQRLDGGLHGVFLDAFHPEVPSRPRTGGWQCLDRALNQLTTIHEEEIR